MLRYTLRKIAVAFLVAVTVSFVAFMMLRVSGDLATALGGESAKGEDIERLRTSLGLDKPLLAQYWLWFTKAAFGDFGKSFYFPGTVWGLIGARLPTTLTLASFGLLVSLLVGVPLGVIAALRPNTMIDRLAMGIAVLGQALPTFWVALLAIIYFGLELGWLPISGDDTWAHYVLPSAVLGYYAAPAVMRLTRSGMLEVLGSDYIRTAYAKGLPERTVLFKHALRNAVIPVVALASVQFGHMLSGSVVIETVFAMQGIGQLAWQSISRQDFPVVQAVLLLVSMFYVWLTFATDLLNAWLDPRIRVG